jgi:hypothetical protein
MTASHSLCLLTVIASFSAVGCGRTEAPQSRVDPVEAATTETADHEGHGGWWCNEHGVPESVCGLCDSKLAASFQKKGDWCQTHDRPDSQCFVCHPEHEARFAAQYEAKYGKKPPKPEG